MKKYILSILLISGLIFSSCVRSLYPITEDEKQIVFNKELLGHWKDDDGNNYFVDSSTVSGIMTYHIQAAEAEKKMDQSNKDVSDTSYFLASLVNINGKLFLDCVPDMEQLAVKKVSESTMGSLLATHFLIRVFSIEQNSVEVAAIDEETLSTLIKQNKINIHHEQIDKDDILLSEKSKMLQQKLVELEKFPSVYKERNRLIRII